MHSRVHSLILHTYWEFFDSPEFAHPGLWLLYSFGQVFGEDDTHCEELGVSLYLIASILAFFYSCFPFDSLYIGLSVCSVTLLNVIM